MGFRKASARLRARIKIRRIISFIDKGDKILDIGTGNGAVAHLLQKEGFPTEVRDKLGIFTTDIIDKRVFKDVPFVLFDGNMLPFEDGSFDCVLILTVLHHAHDPVKVLQEAKRVSAGRIIVIEDVYKNILQKYLTYFMDSLVNFEFAGHPHNNKTSQEWLETFRQMNLRVRDIQEKRFLLFFRQVTFILEK